MLDVITDSEIEDFNYNDEPDYSNYTYTSLRVVFENMQIQDYSFDEYRVEGEVMLVLPNDNLHALLKIYAKYNPL
jgi:hypothetical protein